MQREKKTAAPICLPFLLDGLGSREVFFVKTARVYRGETRITIRNTECRNVTRKRGGNYPLDGTKKFKNPTHIGDKREDHRKKNHP